MKYEDANQIHIGSYVIPKNSDTSFKVINVRRKPRKIFQQDIVEFQDTNGKWWSHKKLKGLKTT